MDRFCLGTLLQTGQRVRGTGFGKLGRPSLFGGFPHPAITDATRCVNAKFLTDSSDCLTRRISLACLDSDPDFQYAFFLSAQHCESAVGRHFLERFSEVRIIPKFVSLFAFDQP